MFVFSTFIELKKETPDVNKERGDDYDEDAVF